MISAFFDHISEAAAQQNLPLPEMCLRVKAMGYDGVHMNIALLDKLPMLTDAGLKVCGLFALEELGRGDKEANVDKGIRLLEKAKQAGSPTMLFVPGFGEENTDRKSAAFLNHRDAIAETLRALIAPAAALGVTCVMEEFGNLTDPFCYSDELYWLLENVPGMMCTFDTGNFLYVNQDPGEEILRFLPYVRDVHCKDWVLSPALGDPLTTLAGTKLYPCAVGDGIVPMEKIIRTLTEAGYQGCFAAEHYGSPDQARDLERSALFLKKC